jgi:hypothetical protein
MIFFHLQVLTGLLQKFDEISHVRIDNVDKALTRLRAAEYIVIVF